MNRIQEIIARCKAIDARQQAIEDEMEVSNAGHFTDEAREEYQQLKDEFDALIAKKQQLEADAAMRAERSGRAQLLEPATLPRRSSANSGSQLAGGADNLPGTPIEEGRETENNGVRVGVGQRIAIPANVRRHNPRYFNGTVDGVTAEERAYRFGQFCLAKLSNDMPGRYRFAEATRFVNAYMGGLYNVAHGEDSVSGGHVLVPDEFSSDLIALREKYGVARQLLGMSVMTSDTKSVPKRTGGLTAYFANENAAGTESNMTWGNVQLVAKKLVAIARISNELSADAVISIGDELAYEIAYAFASKEDNCAFIGDGTSTYGGIRGATNLLTDCDGAGTDSAGLVTQGTGNTWSAITDTDLMNLLAKCPDYADTNNAAFVCHRAFFFSVMERIIRAAGGTTATEMVNGVRRYLYDGYPVIFANAMPRVTAVSTVSVLFGDFSQGAKFGDRQQTSIMFSESAVVGGESVFEQDQIAVRGTERLDINVHGCGDATNPGPIVGLTTAS